MTLVVQPCSARWLWNPHVQPSHYPSRPSLRYLPRFRHSCQLLANRSGFPFLGWVWCGIQLPGSGNNMEQRTKLKADAFQAPDPDPSHGTRSRSAPRYGARSAGQSFPRSGRTWPWPWPGTSLPPPGATQQKSGHGPVWEARQKVRSFQGDEREMRPRKEGPGIH